MRVCIWAFWFCLSSRSCCSNVRLIHYEQGGTCRAFSEISRRILERVDSDDQEDCIRSAVKKVKEVHSIKWKKVGNESNSGLTILWKPDLIQPSSPLRKRSWIRQKKSWKRVRSFCLNVLIKLADRSECGWATVSAYVTDDLADSPEDERHISKAEKSAKEALNSKREKSRVKSGSANYKSNHASFCHVSNSRLGADDAVKSFRLQPFQFRQAAFLPRSQFRRGTCFACGSEGHWRNNCPNLISSGRSDKSTK